MMSYNLLNYDTGVKSTLRDAYFRTVIQETKPDILSVGEVSSSAAAVQHFLTDVVNAAGNGTYAAAPFIDGPDTDNALFYRTDKVVCLGNTAIPTALRNINEFLLVFPATKDTLRVYSIHLKASQTSADEAKRAAEVDILRARTNALPPGSNFLVTGDFNIYASTESAYQKLVKDDAANDGHFVDPVPTSGGFNQAAYAGYHTQSTRSGSVTTPGATSADGGATGGLDDRFDMILFSRAASEAGGIAYVAGSTTPVGNDGAHFNASINTSPNSSASADLANALYYASDHLPVTAQFRLSDPGLPVQLMAFNAVSDNVPGGVLISWSMASETGCFGFELERRRDDQPAFALVPGSFVAGHGTTVQVQHYAVVDTPPQSGTWWYRLLQRDLDGAVSYSDPVSASVVTTGVAQTAPVTFRLDQNYPNPFNSTTTLSYSLPSAQRVSLAVYDVLGHRVETLVDAIVPAGVHQVRWVASTVSSGVYIARLQAGELAFTRRMILMR